jgi:hypothetical protein
VIVASLPALMEEEARVAVGVIMGRILVWISVN